MRGRLSGRAKYGGKPANKILLNMSADESASQKPIPIVDTFASYSTISTADHNIVGNFEMSPKKSPARSANAPQATLVSHYRSIGSAAVLAAVLAVKKRKPTTLSGKPA